MRRETEGLSIDTQDQALPTRFYQVKIMGKQGTGMCRKCGKGVETVMHRLSECEKLAQIESKTRHDKVATIIHSAFCKFHFFKHSKKWYKQPPCETSLRQY